MLYTVEKRGYPLVFFAFSGSNGISVDPLTPKHDTLGIVGCVSFNAIFLACEDGGESVCLGVDFQHFDARSLLL